MTPKVSLSTPCLNSCAFSKPDNNEWAGATQFGTFNRLRMCPMLQVCPCVWVVSSPLIRRLVGPVRVLNTSIVVCYENLGTR